MKRQTIAAALCATAIVACAGAPATQSPSTDPAATLPLTVAGIALSKRQAPAGLPAWVTSLGPHMPTVQIIHSLGLTAADVTSSAEVGDYPTASSGSLPRSLNITETRYRGADPARLLAAYIATWSDPYRCPTCPIQHLSVSGKPVVLIGAPAYPTSGLFAYVKSDVLYEVSVHDLQGTESRLATAALAALP